MRPLKMICVLVLGGLFLAGCMAGTRISTKAGGLLESDLRTGVQVAEANRDLLGNEDQWAACYLKAADAIKRIAGVDEVGKEDGFRGLFTLAMKLHILDRVRESLQEDVRSACGQVMFDVMMQAVRRGPGVL